ncbi:MAG: hypothetical protein KDH95_08055 [Calditrichaeota bacterium]|nr:hypothetical protein [Calditrichota bacterium]MCB0268102.1 hypothetical protein [Calditrichota bacterium]
MKFVLCFIICVYSTFARSEKLYFFSGFKSSQNNQFQLTLEGYAFEGPVGDQRLIIKEANIILTDTLTNTPVIPDISNKGDLAIPYPDKIIFYNKYFIPIQ